MPNRSTAARAKDVPVATYVEGERLAFHKGTGQAYFLLPDHDGLKKRWWMGRYYARRPGGELDRVTMTKASRWIREYRALGTAPPKDRIRFGGQSTMTVAEIVGRYMKHVETYYGADSSEWYCNAAVTDVMKDLFGDVYAEEFGPLKLKAVRDQLVKIGRWNRLTVNRLVGCVRRLFKWAAGNELLPLSVLEALRTVDGLHCGRTTAREPDKVGPVAVAAIEAVLPHVSPQVRAMIELQRLTGMRPGEVVILRPCDVERTEEVWTYRPARHKTQHRGHERVVALGPNAQRILAPFLLRAAEEYAFSPVEAENARREARHALRRTPIGYGNTPGSNRMRNPEKHPGDRYTTASYRRAIGRGCLRAGIPSWHPHQLRHSAATELRRKYGIEAARVTLGHTDAGVTLIYAEADQALANKIAKEVG